MKQYEFINILRPIAAFWVLIAHCLIWGGYEGSVLDPKLAVDLFMMISGFLMSAIAVERSMLDGGLFGKGLLFLGKRFFRIAPAYYVSLLMAFLLGDYFLNGYTALQQLSPDKWTWPNNEIYNPNRLCYNMGNLISHVTFAFGLSPKGSFSSFLPDWSLGLEMQFYAAFPILFALRKRVGIHAIGVAAAAAILLTGKLLSHMEINFYEPSFLMLKLNFFVVGMLMYHFREQNGMLGKLKSAAVAILLIWCDRKGVFSFSIATGMAAIMLVLHEMEDHTFGVSSLLHRFRIRQIIEKLSEWSYGVYLFHGFFISLSGHFFLSHQATRNERSFGMIPFVIVGSLCVSAVIHRFVERPGVAVGNQILRWLYHLPARWA